MRSLLGKEKRQAKDPVASIGDVLSFVFSRGRSTSAIFLFGCIAAFGNGIVYPALADIFADTSFRLAGAALDGLELIREIVYVLIGVGGYAFLCTFLQTICLETAAARATHSGEDFASTPSTITTAGDFETAINDIPTEVLKNREWIESKACFRGYGLWFLPPKGSKCDLVCRKIMQTCSGRFPPLRTPVWQPHISIVAGVTDKEALLQVAKQLTDEFQGKSFTIGFGNGAQVDLESDRKTIFFSWQRLRAVWMHSSTNEGIVNKHGEDSLGDFCRRARELLGEKTSTEKFVPHLSLVYFDQDELSGDQRIIMRDEVQKAFPLDVKMEVDTIHISKADGVPGTWKILHSFAF